MSNKTILNIGMIGLGQRGRGLLNTVLANSDVNVIAVCDLYEDRAIAAMEVIKEKRNTIATTYTKHAELFKHEGLDAVIVSSSWESHIEVSIESLKAGIPTAMEVGGAYSIEECFELVKTYEATKTPFMFLENCCYDRTELMATAMARKGLFGEIVYCSGAYSHDLRDEISQGNRNRHYRLRNYLNRNCENYPTHELGPIAKLLDINRGNRMISLVSVASKASGLEEYVKNSKDPDPVLIGKKFKQGDIVNTIITCANGATISLILDTTLPGIYDRAILIKGTKGMYNQSNNYAVLDSEDIKHEWTGVKNHLNLINTATKYEEEFLPEMWKKITAEELELGHGGMDFFSLKAFFNALRNNEEMPIDVYDGASWMAVSCLSEKSIALGNHPVEIPDFTNGKWLTRPRKDVIDFSAK